MIIDLPNFIERGQPYWQELEDIVRISLEAQGGLVVGGGHARLEQRQGAREPPVEGGVECLEVLAIPRAEDVARRAIDRPSPGRLCGTIGEEHDSWRGLGGMRHVGGVADAKRAAEQAGARAASGGRRFAELQGHFMAPTIIADATADMTIAREEVFGPVLTVLPFSDDEEAIAMANGTDFGLCAGVYTKNLDKAHWTADRLNAGQIFVNEWFAGGIETPFGGTKRSGYGREKGQEALFNYV